VAFQPHRYTRTQALAESFGECFYQAAHVVLLPVYAAGEAPIPGVDAGLIAEAIRRHSPASVTLVRDQAEAVNALYALAQPGDVVITQGAGDVSRLGEALLERLRVPAERSER